MDETLDCRSEEGITVGLIDALITIYHVLAERELLHGDHVKEALTDLLMDESVDRVVAAACHHLELGKENLNG